MSRGITLKKKALEGMSPRCKERRDGEKLTGIKQKSQKRSVGCLNSFFTQKTKREEETGR